MEYQPAQSVTTELQTTVYTPESPLQHPGKLLSGMMADLFAARGLAWRLFVRDISAMYRQSFLGYFWAFMPPVITTLTFVFLSSQGIVNLGDTKIPYPAYVLIGTFIWQSFADALNNPLRIVNQSRGLLTKINFPREALILSGLGEVIFNLLIRSTLLIPVFIYYKFPLSTTMLLVPAGIAVLILLGLSIGILLTPIGLLYGDIAKGLMMLTGLWMLLTPVVYPKPSQGIGAWLATWNPVSPLIITTREWMMGQPLTQLTGFFLVVVLGLVMLFVGWLIYRLTMPILVERLGG